MNVTEIDQPEINPTGRQTEAGEQVQVIKNVLAAETYLEGHHDLKEQCAHQKESEGAADQEDLELF
jgi:hypothetical protein